MCIDIRVVAATKVDLNTLVEQEQFRSDLFYRLNLLKLQIHLYGQEKRISRCSTNILVRLPQPDFTSRCNP